MAKVVMDAGHGGSDPGAVSDGRREKDDNLALALAVGSILAENGVDVVYTRTDDTYETPFQKAQKGNQEGADLFISIHRNSSPEKDQYSGVETLLYDESGIKKELAENINRELAKEGFQNLGIRERPGLVVLRRTRMPAALIEVGFINTQADNELLDQNFDGVVRAIADGILMTLRKNGLLSEENRSTALEYSEEPDGSEHKSFRYRVQTGAFRREENAWKLYQKLLKQCFPAEIGKNEDFFLVWVGNYEKLDNAVKMEQKLKRLGYAAYITRTDES
ncbi:MAG: N-acetylmuramoyl-L-alanine amidase [Lachnospiraceae bacterium]|uniref:N-acetylmuramoyl-L-alanine amidase n=1 Tax=Blautia sp. OF03-15BH TaxID=2292287 RepID=UPI000E4700A2|nr:N-acetylmuramoyl-L-alanine amidase [Blautia sp. OF03-15BH]MBD9014397.1 N-acetylmuramoyl-L-alanine amidase [Lachnospiraceae bacterium]RGY02937.1 N-acetylmuramoyl-L-alanine amidase [Blautia sp. OF03-15BH]